MRNDTPLVGRLRAHAGFVENGGCADHSMTDEAALISEAADRIEKLEAALRPFADRCDEAVRYDDGDRIGVTIKIGFIRAARAALNGE